MLCPIFWSLAIWPDHVRSNVAKLTWQNCDQSKWSSIKISPVQFGLLHGLNPIIRPINIFSSNKSNFARRAEPNIFYAFSFMGLGMFRPKLFFLFFSELLFHYNLGLGLFTVNTSPLDKHFQSRSNNNIYQGKPNQVSATEIYQIRYSTIILHHIHISYRSQQPTSFPE